MTKKERDRARFWRYMRRTLTNKIYSLLFIAIGSVVMFISEDATGLVFSLIFAVPMFFSWESWF